MMIFLVFQPVKEVGDLISEAMEDFDDEGDTGHGSGEYQSYIHTLQL